MSKAITLKPRVSEKSYGLSQTHNAYVIDVPKSANKLTIKQAVEAQFGVTVSNVNVALIKGKSKRTVRKNGRAVIGKRTDIKKAYVTLSEGQSLPVFAAIDAAAKEQEVADAKSKKKLAKENK